MKKAEEIFHNKLVHYNPEKFPNGMKKAFYRAMEEYAKEGKPLKDKIFEVANELAVLGYGNEAVRLHQIHNSLPSPPKTENK